MKLLVLSPDFASHYGPLSVLAGAVRATGGEVTVATGPGLRQRVEADGFRWRPLRLGAGANDGVATDSPAIRRFIEATRSGAVATLRRQALDRERDLLWEPEAVAADVARLCDDVDPDEVMVDHVSFGSTLAAYATGRPFVTLVPGHPTQLPVGEERYGVPPAWPVALRPAEAEVDELLALADRVADAFTARWNRALATIAPGREPVSDAFRVHGHRVLYNTPRVLHDPSRSAALPREHRFVGPLVRAERLPDAARSWAEEVDRRPRVYAALGTFLSRRSDVLMRIADALLDVGARAAIAVGPTPVDALGPIPDDWLVAPRLPQVALLRAADIAIHHGGNNSVQESVAAGVHQLVLPFSTDQFSTAADLECSGAAVLSPNEATASEIADAVIDLLTRRPPPPVAPLTAAELTAAVFDRPTGAPTGARP